MGAAFLCHDSAITSVLENQAAYIAGWLKALKSDPKLVIQAAGKAQAAAKLVLNKTEEQAKGCVRERKTSPSSAIIRTDEGCVSQPSLMTRVKNTFRKQRKTSVKQRRVA